MKYKEQSTKQKWADDFKFRQEYASDELSRFEVAISKFKSFYSAHMPKLESLSKIGWNWSQEIYSREFVIQLSPRSGFYHFNTGPKQLSPSTPKEVAKIFGVEGWNRATDNRKCGSINWTKEFGGCLLSIEAAELISPKLIKEVKF